MFGISESTFEIIGIMTVLYAICRVFHFWVLVLEDRGKDHGFGFWIVFAFTVIFGFFSVPVCIVLTFIGNAHSSRIHKMHEKEINAVRCEYIERCSHCRKVNHINFYEFEDMCSCDPVDFLDFED